MRSKLSGWIAGLILVALAVPAWGSQPTGQLKGTVSFQRDGETVFLAGANVVIRSPILPNGMLTTLTDENGRFVFADLIAGTYTISVQLQGFKPLTKTITIKPDTVTEIALRLEIEELTENITVIAQPEGIETIESTQRAEVGQREITYAPLVNEKFQDTLPLIPGVVRGPDGLINIKGARSHLSGLLVNGTNATDPVTGASGISLPIDAVQSVEVLSSPYLAEYGKFAGGVTTVETKAGGDKWRVSFNNFVPRPRRRKDPFTGRKALVGIEAWTPRLRFSGPLVKDRLVWAQTFQYRFIRTKIDVLPDPQEPPVFTNERGEVERDTELESFDSFTEFTYHINSKNDLTVTLSVYPQNNRFVNLNAFNPPLVTPNYRQRGFQLAFNERAFLTSNLVLDSLISIRQFDVDIFPNGPHPMVLTPDINTGNFFNRQDRNTDRIEVVETLSYQPSLAHLFKFGADIAHTSFDGLHQSFPVRIQRADGTLSQLITFDGDPFVERDNTEVTLFAQDKWLVNEKITFDLGLRYDREGVADENLFAPRFGFVIVPWADNRTAIRGGIGLFWGKMQLNVGVFDQLQQRLVTIYGPDGLTPIGPTRRFINVIDGGKPRTPYNLAWNVEVDRELTRHLTLRIGYLQRDGRREFIINPLEDPLDPTRGILELSNGGRSRYREFQITGRYQFGEGSTLFISYVRSSATGDLNNFNQFFGNFENPIIRPNEVSRLDFDAPNRLLFWGNIQLPWELTIFPVLDVHDGFPYSLLDEDRNFIGRRNRAGRFPVFASLDLQVTKGFSLRVYGRRYHIRVGVKLFNVTNRFNPRDVQNNLDSAAFGRFFNSVGTLVRGTFQIDF